MKLKDKIEIVILIAIFLLSSYVIYNFVESETINIVTNEEVKFKEEYESLNNMYDEQRGQNYINVDILENSNVKYVSENQVIDILKNETGIIYFGFPECPWCRNIVPILVNTLSNYDLSFYYSNIYEIRDNKHLDEDNNIIIDKMGSKEYYQILELLGENISPYYSLNDDSIKRIYFPTIVFVKEGIIIGVHQGTIDSQSDPFEPLSIEQKTEISLMLESYIQKTYDITCDKNC